MHEIPLRCDVKIERPVYESQDLRETFQYHEKPDIVKNHDVLPCTQNAKKCLRSKLPLIDSLSHNYDWTTDFLLDIMAGLTIGIIQIPQGMAYALLGNVSPIIGVYMSFFPVLIYSFLGSSRHNSIGTFSIGCIMTGKVVLEYSNPAYFNEGYTLNYTVNNGIPHYGVYSPIEVATVVTFAVALFQFAMYMLRLGVISLLLSDKLISGFICGAALQVAVSLLRDLLGLKIPVHAGYFQTIYTFVDVLQEIQHINYVTSFLTTVIIVILTLDILFLKPAISKVTLYPFPSELIIIVVFTVASSLMDFSGNYGVTTIGTVPTGLPSPFVPPLELLPSVMLDAFAIAATSYALTLSMAFIPAKKHNHQIDANQELLALGFSNLCSSFFSCMPSSASLTRTLIQEKVGGKTHITSLTSCGVLLLVMLWIGPYFESLPKCVLASVILVTLSGCLSQVLALPKYWKLSKTDAIIWLSTYLATALIHIDAGLIIGAIVSMVSLLILTIWPQTCLLGQVPETDIFLDTSRYKNVAEIPGVKIFHYSGSINFATRCCFTENLYSHIKMDPRKEVIYRGKLRCLLENNKLNNVDNKENNAKLSSLQAKVHYELKHIILSFSSVNRIDTAGVDMLKTVTNDLRNVNVTVSIAGCSDAVYDMMKKCGFLQRTENSVKSYPSIKDAVESIKPNKSSNPVNSYNISIISR